MLKIHPNKFHLCCLYLFLTHLSSAQVDSNQVIPNKSSPWKWSGYVEIYATAAQPTPMRLRHPSFQYSYHKLGGVQLNLGMVELGYQSKRIRGNLGFGAGTYMDRNLSGESSGWKNTTQANVGIALDRQQRWWIDVGVFPSHIGAESAVGMNCINLSRSVVADNSPYYESGMKWSGQNKKKTVQFSLLMLNGWQRMRFLPEQSMAIGHQIVYQPNEKWLINSSGFWGEAAPGTKRLYHNFYMQWQPDTCWRVLLGWDIGRQLQSGQQTNWQSPMIQANWRWNRTFTLGARAEYFYDPGAALIPKNDGNSFQTWGASLNIDWRVNALLLWRAEYRYFQNRTPYFMTETTTGRTYQAFNTSLSCWL